VKPGERQRLELPVARLPTGTRLSLPVTVVHGHRTGPRLWLSAAIHGDEINGVEIIRQVLEEVEAEGLRGTLVAVPVVNVFGFIHQSRYLPDRRDLNRSFPGSARGSMAARLAHLFMTEVVKRCTHGVDLHTGSDHRVNLPQVRADLEDPGTLRIARAFGSRLMVHARLRDGSLRDAAAKAGIPVLVYEAGEALRFDDEAIEIGVNGILRLMSVLGMRPLGKRLRRSTTVAVARTLWVRARRAGVLHLEVVLGQRVRQGQQLGIISDATGETFSTVRARCDGLVMAHRANPLVNRGDALVHLAVREPAGAAGKSGGEPVF
jgi:predicted deacylase